MGDICRTVCIDDNPVAEVDVHRPSLSKIARAFFGSCRGSGVTAVSLAAAAPQDLTRPRAILFDWDNTLVDSWTTIHEALNAVMAAMEKPLWSLRETKERVRLSLRESFPLSFRRPMGGGAARSISMSSARSISTG